MSAVPPTGTEVSPALPWESRGQHGVVPAFVETVKLFLSNPEEAWRRTRETGGFEDPLLFGLASALVGAVFSAVYRMMFFPFWVRFLPFPLRSRWAAFGSPRLGGCSLLIAPIVTAICMTVGLFIAAGVFHVCLMMVGGLSHSTSRFEGTFRTVSYSSVSLLANIIPFVGAFIGFVWGFFLNVKGAMRMHRTTAGKAVAALLIPLAILILLLIAVLAVIVGMLVATRPSG